MNKDTEEFLIYIMIAVLGVLIGGAVVLIIGFLLLWPIFGSFNMPPKILPDYLSCCLYGILTLWLLIDKVEYKR